MARSIKETPILKGKDAYKFANKTANPVLAAPKEREKTKKVFEKFQSIATFAL